MNQLIWQQPKVILVQQRRNTRNMMLIGQLSTPIVPRIVQVDVLSLLMVLLVVFTVQQVPYHFVISIRHTTNNHIHIRRDTIKKMVQSNLSTTNYKKYSNNMVNIISPTTPLQKIILLFYCTVPSRHYNRIIAQSDTKSKPITDTSTTAILCRGGGGGGGDGGHNNDTGFYCNDTDPNRSTSIYLQYDNYTQQNQKIIDGQCSKVDKYEYGSYEIGSLLTKNNYYDDRNIYNSMVGDEEYENDEFYYDDDEEYDEDDDDDDDDDYECENDDQYSTSQYTSSNTSLSTMFHPPSVKLNDMVSALLYTCTMNNRLQQFVMLTKQSNVLYNQQQRLLMQKYNKRPGINITSSSSSFRFLPTSRLVTNTPQRLLRGGSSSSSTSNGGMTLSQVEHNVPIQFSSSSSYHDQKKFRTLYNYYKLPITTMSENDKHNHHHHRDISSTNDVWTTKSISSLHSPTQSNLVEQKQLLNYLHLLVRDVLDILTEDDDDDHRTNLSGGDNLSNMPKSIDSIRQLQSNLELTLSMIYLDRACSVVTARDNNKQTNGISTCPPCTACTIHRLVLASLLLSVSSVRRISVDDIVQSKFVQLSKVLQLHGIIRINESYRTTTSTSTKQEHNSSTSIDHTDDDIKELQQIINDMVQSFKHALGDCGIFVTMEEMKDFRQIWEKSFGPSSQSTL